MHYQDPAESRRASIFACGPSPDFPIPIPTRRANMARVPSPTIDPIARSSFSSVRENDDGLVQTFTHSKISSYTDVAEEAVDESPVSETPPQPSFQPPVTRPNSKLNGFWYPADGFRGWRDIPIKGKIASRSCEDLRSLRLSWDAPRDTTIANRRTSQLNPAGTSPFEMLPNELISNIIDRLFVEIPPNGLSTRNADLMSLLLVSRSLHAATLATLYQHITIPHSRIFRKFLETITAFPSLASIVRRLDFSHFNPSMLFTTASQRAQTRNLTSETLVKCLELTPHLQEFLAQEYVEEDISADVLRKLFFHSPRIQAIDLCACASKPFKLSMAELLKDSWPRTLSISRLSLHKCSSLTSDVFENLLFRLPQLTHLDVACTRITDEALLSIPSTARLSHLNLARCRDLSSEAVIQFVSSHPAAQSLVYLSLATSSHLLLGKDDIDQLLPKLPTTLRSLCLRGSRMDASHIPQLKRLTGFLEELSIGRGLSLGLIESIFYQGKEAIPHNLKYLDISHVDAMIGSASVLLAPATAPLHVIEIDEKSYERAAKSSKNFASVGWKAQEFGCRYWLVRMNPDGTTRDRGSRWWKHGAESWGMRKIPVATAEVGGMYGSFMFGRDF